MEKTTKLYEYKDLQEGLIEGLKRVDRDNSLKLVISYKNNKWHLILEDKE